LNFITANKSRNHK